MKKILIVDDEMQIRDLIKERLTQEKYAVMTAPSGNEALIIAKTNLPDLILLDIAMPQMDGYTVCENLRKNPKTKDIPVIFLTGKDLEAGGIDERCQDLSAQGHVSKLSTLKELTGKIKEVFSLLVLFLFLLSAVITQSQALAANVTPAQVERSEQLIDQQGLLRQRLEKGAKVFVKEIEVTGASLIKTEDIKELIKPLEKSWVYKSDIQTVIESIKELYNKSGYEKRLKNITYQIKDGLLKIQIEEQNPLTK